MPISAGKRSGPGGSLGVVVVGDDAADRDPGLGVEQREDGVEDLAADVLVIDVDAVRAGLGQSFGEVRGMVVEAGIEAEHLHGVAAFFRTAGDADHSAAL